MNSTEEDLVRKIEQADKSGYILHISLDEDQLKVVRCLFEKMAGRDKTYTWLNFLKELMNAYLTNILKEQNDFHTCPLCGTKIIFEGSDCWNGHETIFTYSCDKCGILWSTFFGGMVDVDP
jgi:predicted RNA-binding Zn-ribbon protein involved in translation (DUF1610 family)